MCLSYLTFFHGIKDKISKQVFSLNLTCLEILLERLATFLSPSHKTQWTGPTEKDPIMSAQSDELWRRLCSGGYKPTTSSMSIKNITKLTEKTIQEAGALTLDQMRTIVTDIMELMRNSGYDPAFVTQVVRVIKTFASYHHGSSIGAPVMAELFKIWDKLGSGKSCIGKALIETSRHLNFQIPENLRLEIENKNPVVREKCSCCGWDEKKTSCLTISLAKLKHEHSLSRQSTLERTSSSESQSSLVAKKRKMSRDTVDEVVKRIEADVEYLTRQNSDNLEKYKDDLYKVKLKIESVI